MGIEPQLTWTAPIRLRPEEYRRLWASIRSDFKLDRARQPEAIAHPGYGPSDAFYWATGKFHALRTCNSWAASDYAWLE